jgi:hypothetical protein
VARELQRGITFDLRHEVYSSEYRATPNPKGVPYDSQYGLCFRYCLSYLVNELVSTGKWHCLHIVLERGHKNSGDCEKIFDETKLTLQAKGFDVLGDFTIARKEEAAPLMAADFLAHSYMMLRASGELESGSLGDEKPGNYTERLSKGLRYLGLEPDAIPDLKRRLQQDRWERQAYRKRLKIAASSVSRMPSSGELPS